MKAKMNAAAPGVSAPALLTPSDEPTSEGGSIPADGPNTDRAEARFAAPGAGGPSASLSPEAAEARESALTLAAVVSRCHLEAHTLEVDGELLLLNGPTQEVCVLNAVGAAVWDLMDGERSLQEIAACVAQDLTVDVGTAERDVLSFGESLRARGLCETR